VPEFDRWLAQATRAVDAFDRTVDARGQPAPAGRRDPRYVAAAFLRPLNAP